jgi:cell division protein FtsB
MTTLRLIRSIIWILFFSFLFFSLSSEQAEKVALQTEKIRADEAHMVAISANRKQLAQTEEILRAQVSSIKWFID